MAKRDFYEVLGVARGADADTIRKAYRKLARQTHPDLNPGDEAAAERFKEISHAWEILEDPEKRKLYDEFGDVSLESGFDADRARQAKEAFAHRFGGGAPGAGSEEFHFGDIDDLLGRFFGGERPGFATQGGARGLKLRGADVEAELELDFLDAVRGGEKRLALGGDSVTVRIPPGVDTGGRLRIPGRGGPGVGGGPPGDLFVRLRVRPHRIFRRDGRDLELDLPLSVREAIRGAQVDVPTLDGRVTLTIPAGTHSGTRLRLRGKGVPSPSGGKAGDLFVRIQIRVPSELDAEAESAVDALERFEDPAIRKELFS